MPFINETDKRTVLQEAQQDFNIPTSSFGETFTASLGMTIDEDLSISSALNREGWENRRELISNKIDDGSLDRDNYMDVRGRFDYNRAADDLADPTIKNDQVLTEERNQLLSGRRKYAQDVIDRGNGMAQFLGMANAFMLDPISIATMPIALPATTAKSLSIAGRALLTARNAAVIETATELAIQPFVYEHKQDIESPYTYKDALVNIAGAAVGASVLGGVAGGVSGYLRKVRGEVEAKGVITPEVESALENLGRMQESIDYGRSQRQTYDVAMGDYDKLMQGEYDSFASAAKASIRTLEKEAQAIRSESKTLKQFIQDKGGMDRSIMKAEGIDPQDFKRQGANPMFRKSGGRTPDEIAEGLNEIGFRGRQIDANDVINLVDDVVRGIDDHMIDGDAAGKIEFLQRQIDDLSAQGDEAYLEGIYKGARENDVQADIDYLEALEVERDLVKRPQTTPDQYDTPPKQKASKASTSQRENFILDEQGLSDDFNADMQRFNELDNPRIMQDDEIVDASEFMKSIDDELEGIDSVLTCAYG
ncbi:MAG: hypothetical protein ACW99G_15995 [Candidatus Thorarchaeota archaeon]|jgi:hypothetical protein